VSVGERRRRSLHLHGLWAGLVLSSNRLDRWLGARGAPPGSSLPVIVLPWYGLLLLSERRRPFRTDWNPGGAEIRTDAGFLAASATAATTGQALGAGLARRLRLRRAGPGRTRPRPGVERLGIGGGVVASLLTSDFIHYWLHRLGHESGPAWRFHSVHHSPERLHILNATRFHPVEQLLEGVLEGFGLEMVGFSPAQHVAHATARATYGQLQHANIDVDSGALDHVFATPDLHRWHHSEVYAEGDNNYGAVTSVWDRVFGTFFRPTRAFDAELGVGRMPEFPGTLPALLRVPFRWRALKRRNARTWYGTRDTNPDRHRRS
jgi:sterol desaturase/sphingolipid hydroxylase (fatty acid hydroxylase superfamily)